MVNSVLSTDVWLMILIILWCFHNFVIFFQDISDCKKDIPSSFTHSESVSPLCYVLSGEDGTFVFPSLPVGDFFIVSLTWFLYILSTTVYCHIKTVILYIYW